MKMSNAKVKYYPEKRVFKQLVVFFVLGLFIGSSYGQTGLGVKTVVIDPGHGGKDPGAVSPNDNYEKTVVLNVGLLLGKKIKEAYPEVNVIYTRDSDEFIGLADRASVANKAGADLFISLHCNAAGNKSAKGLESWVLGLHKSEASLEVAKKENSAILMEDGHESTYEDFDPNDPDAYIALSMRQNAFLDQSLVFADLVQKNGVEDLKRHNRGVKQAGFVVLYRATMPSVLVELGFLSNKEDEKFLTSEDGQDQIAKELFDAFSGYKKYKEKVDGLSTDPEAISNKEIKEDPKEDVTEDDSGVIFKVQIATSSLNLPTKPENFKGMTDVEMASAGKWYKYFVGKYKTVEEAKARQKEVQELGYDTAFIVAYENGVKISVSDAIEKVK